MSELDDRPPRLHDGLSPSSLALFLGCQRKYYWKKVARVPIDDDSSEDTESFKVGKAFHKCLENVRHELEGYRLSDVTTVTAGYGLDAEQHGPLIFAMLGAYKRVHAKAGLKALACEQVIDTPAFYGFVDVILEDEAGWWIGDMKTAANYSTHLMPTLPRHPQLSLYAMHVPEIAEALKIDPDRYRGCRYRMTTKSKAVKRSGETPMEFAKRLSGVVTSYDFIIPSTAMLPQEVFGVHANAKLHIDSYKEQVDFLPNYGNCLSYFRPCEWWSKCHGARFTDMQDLVVLKSD